MQNFTETVYEAVLQALLELKDEANILEGQLLVVGASTSEVIGKKIGTAGSAEVAEAIFKAVQAFRSQTRIELAFQCCEHLNRALVIEQTVQNKYNLEQVSVIPVNNAGGALASYAYRHLHNPTVVEFIKADVGIDIGNTLIGMHLKHVAVPVRCSVKKVGEAPLTLAKTRPKLIGGQRAIYEVLEENSQC